MWGDTLISLAALLWAGYPLHSSFCNRVCCFCWNLKIWMHRWWTAMYRDGQCRAWTISMISCIFSTVMRILSLLFQLMQLYIIISCVFVCHGSQTGLAQCAALGLSTATSAASMLHHVRLDGAVVKPIAYLIRKRQKFAGRSFLLKH